MAKNTSPYVVSAPGFWGINTQDAPVDLSPNFALVAYNCVIDKYGRIGARKGWTKQHTANSDLGTSDIECLGELIENNGTSTTLAAGGGYLFTLAGTTLTTLTYGGGGVAPTITANNWQFVKLNGIGLFFQIGHDPLIYDPAVSTTTYRRLSEKTAYAGTVPLANCALSAYGRIWCANTTTDKNTLTWSDIITPQVWTGGTSGSLNLLGVWPNGGDEINGLAAHNNFLIIFGKKQTLIYSGADDPAQMVLHDAIDSMGCIARDSIQNTNDDVLFLSALGVVSINRTIQEKSAPINRISKNVESDLQNNVEGETLSGIKSVYSPVESFYVLSLPLAKQAYCFDTKYPLENGSLRVTIWRDIEPKAFLYRQDRTTLIGKPGYVGKYTGYLDDEAIYRLMYYTSWIDFGNRILTSILKKVKATLIGVISQSVVFKYAFDFVPHYRSLTTTIAPTSDVALYGEALYGVSEYSSGVFSSIVPGNLGGAGKVVQIGLEMDITGNQVSIQQFEVFTKEGRF
jgi:hypothetical protein